MCACCRPNASALTQQPLFLSIMIRISPLERAISLIQVSHDNNRTGAKIVTHASGHQPAAPNSDAQGSREPCDGGVRATEEADLRSGAGWKATAGAAKEGATQVQGMLRRKPGRGDATRSMSCSDKLARWNVLGLQGALLSQLLACPVYLDACVVSSATFNHDALSRALARRIEHVVPALPVPFALRPPLIFSTPAEFPASRELVEQAIIAKLVAAGAKAGSAQGAAAHPGHKGTRVSCNPSGSSSDFPVPSAPSPTTPTLTLVASAPAGQKSRPQARDA
jgi:hypothetical protein